MKLGKRTALGAVLALFAVAAVVCGCCSLLRTGRPGALAAPRGAFVSSDRVANEAEGSGSFTVNAGEQMVFTTVHEAPPSYSASSFRWRLGKVREGTDVDFEVYDGDGNLFYRNGHKMRLLPTTIRSDFKEGAFGLPSPAPLFGKPIAVVVKVKKGGLRTADWGGYRFEFYEHAATPADWQRPSQTVAAALTGKVRE